MRMNAFGVAAAAGVAAVVVSGSVSGSALGQDGSPLQVRYDFTIEVTENQIIGSPVAGDNPLLAELAVGTTGTLSALVTAIDEFSTDADLAWWQMDEITLGIGSIDLQTESPRYPSSNPLLAFAVLNDSNNTGDLIQFKPSWDDAPFFGAYFEILDLDQLGPFPSAFGDLLDSTDLPTELDLNNENTTSRFEFGTGLAGGFEVTHAITGVTITVIPAPASVALLAPVALGAAHRRRK